MSKTKFRRLILSVVVILAAGTLIITDKSNFRQPETTYTTETPSKSNPSATLASTLLSELKIKGRSPKTGYSRDEFGKGWGDINGCDTRNVILERDLVDTTLNTTSSKPKEACWVLSGILNDPYTNTTITFSRGPGTSSLVQIDHVVALSDAWQKGAQALEKSTRVQFANDPLNLLAVEGAANQQKSDGDAATWLPPNKSFRCHYVARQVSVKYKYNLWVTQAEHDSIADILSTCPSEPSLIELISSPN